MSCRMQHVLQLGQFSRRAPQGKFIVLGKLRPGDGKHHQKEHTGRQEHTEGRCEQGLQRFGQPSAGQQNSYKSRRAQIKQPAAHRQQTQKAPKAEPHRPAADHRQRKQGGIRPAEPGQEGAVQPNGRQRQESADRYHHHPAFSPFSVKSKIGQTGKTNTGPMK